MLKVRLFNVKFFLFYLYSILFIYVCLYLKNWEDDIVIYFLFVLLFKCFNICNNFKIFLCLFFIVFKVVNKVFFLLNFVKNNKRVCDSYKKRII